MSLLHYWSKLARLSPLGEGKKQKDQKVSPLTFPPPSPTTAQQCLNTSGDKNNLQKWSRNYIMNGPNTRHIVGFLVNQIFLGKLHEFFWLHQRQQNRFFTSNNRAPKSHAGICKEIRLVVTSGWSWSKAEQLAAEGPAKPPSGSSALRPLKPHRGLLWSLNWQQRPSWKPGIAQVQFLAQEDPWGWFLAARRGDPWKIPHRLSKRLLQSTWGQK